MKLNLAQILNNFYKRTGDAVVGAPSIPGHKSGVVTPQLLPNLPGLHAFPGLDLGDKSLHVMPKGDLKNIPKVLKDKAKSGIPPEMPDDSFMKFLMQYLDKGKPKGDNFEQAVLAYINNAKTKQGFHNPDPFGGRSTEAQSKAEFTEANLHDLFDYSRGMTREADDILGELIEEPAIRRGQPLSMFTRHQPPVRSWRQKATRAPRTVGSREYQEKYLLPALFKGGDAPVSGGGVERQAFDIPDNNRDILMRGLEIARDTGVDIADVMKKHNFVASDLADPELEADIAKVFVKELFGEIKKIKPFEQPPINKDVITRIAGDRLGSTEDIVGRMQSHAQLKERLPIIDNAFTMARALELAPGQKEIWNDIGNKHLHQGRIVPDSQDWSSISLPYSKQAFKLWDDFYNSIDERTNYGKKLKQFVADMLRTNTPMPSGIAQQAWRHGISKGIIKDPSDAHHYWASPIAPIHTQAIGRGQQFDIASLPQPGGRIPMLPGMMDTPPSSHGKPERAPSSRPTRVGGSLGEPEIFSTASAVDRTGFRPIPNDQRLDFIFNALLPHLESLKRGRVPSTGAGYGGSEQLVGKNDEMLMRLANLIVRGGNVDDFRGMLDQDLEQLDRRRRRL